MSQKQEEELKIIQEDWMVRKWRPAMGWTYMIICILDLAIFPILWSVLQAYHSGQVHNQWQPLTLQGGGLFHMAMGAVLGIAAWSRGQEKIAGVANTATAVLIPKTPINTTEPSTSVEEPTTRNTRND